ncbi:MAG: hypothetical protein IPN33_21035 [Saprospiraceae bacterium]|nr:hypothetical protein [Saprospiraceae bacterium]
MPLALHPDMMIDPEVAAELAATYFGVRAQAKSLPGEIDFNFYLKTKNGDEYTFKISRPGEDPALLDMQVSAMNHPAGQSLPLVLQRPVAGLDGGFCSDGTTSKVGSAGFACSHGRPDGCMPR